MDNGMGEGQKDQSKLLPSEERAIFIFYQVYDFSDQGWLVRIIFPCKTG